MTRSQVQNCRISYLRRINLLSHIINMDGPPSLLIRRYIVGVQGKGLVFKGMRSTSFCISHSFSTKEIHLAIPQDYLQHGFENMAKISRCSNTNKHSMAFSLIHPYLLKFVFLVFNPKISCWLPIMIHLCPYSCVLTSFLSIMILKRILGGSPSRL